MGAFVVWVAAPTPEPEMNFAGDHGAMELPEIPVIQAPLMMPVPDIPQQYPWSDRMFPFYKIMLTDLNEHIPKLENAAEMELRKLIHANLKTLCDLGACGPVYNVSGFVSKNGNHKLFSTITMGHPIGLVYWGSPHWADTRDRYNFQFKSSQEFKTSAFESMSWNAPTGVVAMSFPEVYGVEFWHPVYKKRCREADTRVEGVLLVAQGYWRQYLPMSSGNELQQIHEGSDTRTMIAMLVPMRFMPCLKWKGAKIDVGATFLSIMRTIDRTEKVLELGGQTFAMSMEIHYARLEECGDDNSMPPWQLFI